MALSFNPAHPAASFTRHFYKPQPLRILEEISADILAIEKEAEGLLDGRLKTGSVR